MSSMNLIFISGLFWNIQILIETVQYFRPDLDHPSGERVNNRLSAEVLRRPIWRGLEKPGPATTCGLIAAKAQSGNGFAGEAHASGSHRARPHRPSLPAMNPAGVIFSHK
jgi:hypothetical protein